jgi:hypothetical protein
MTGQGRCGQDGQAKLHTFRNALGIEPASGTELRALVIGEIICG